jgi:hypothetical protein
MPGTHMYGGQWCTVKEDKDVTSLHRGPYVSKELRKKQTP